MSDDPVMDFALRHRDDFQQLVNSGPWKVLEERAGVDVASRMENLLEVEEIGDLRYKQGMIAGIKWVIAYPHLMLEAVRLADEESDGRLASRAEVMRRVK